MATFYPGFLWRDTFDASKPHVPLELEVRWGAVYTGTVEPETEPDEDIPVSAGTPIPLTGGIGPSGVSLGSLPAMLGAAIGRIDEVTHELVFDHSFTQSWLATFSYRKHHIPCRIKWVKTVIDQDSVETTTTGFIDLIPDQPTASMEFTAPTASFLEVGYTALVSFTEVYAPYLG